MSVINIEMALENLKSGLAVIFQTDTLPAVGCLPKFSNTIYEIKRRDKNKPLILMGADKRQLIDYVHESAKEDYENIASKHWPGPLTMVIPVSENKKSIVTSENFTLGLRIPASNMARSFIRETGPLLTSSANISGTKESTTADAISQELPGVNILGPVPWEKCSGKASTIIFWVNQGKWRIIREGQVPSEEIF